MNKKLERAAELLKLFGLALSLWGAMRADGGLTPWLPLALAGMAACLLGLGLGWLCSEEGKGWRRARFGEIPQEPAWEAESKIVVFPKAG